MIPAPAARKASMASMLRSQAAQATSKRRWLSAFSSFYLFIFLSFYRSTFLSYLVYTQLHEKAFDRAPPSAVRQRAFAAYPFEYPIYLGLLGFSKGEISELKNGGMITHSIINKSPGEYGIVAARVFNVPVYYFKEYYN